MALAIRSLESEQYLPNGEVLESILPKFSPRKILGNVWWDTPLGTVVNAGVARMADAGEGLRRTAQHVKAIFVHPPLPSEYVEMAHAFGSQPLLVRERRSSAPLADDKWVAAYNDYEDPQREKSIEDLPTFPYKAIQVRHGRRPPVLPPVRQDPELRPYPSQEYEDPQILPQPGNDLEIQFMRWSPTRRLEYMKELVRKQEHERAERQARVEQEIKRLLARMEEHSRIEEEEFELAQRQRFLYSMPHVIRLL